MYKHPQSICTHGSNHKVINFFTQVNDLRRDGINYNYNLKRKE